METYFIVPSSIAIVCYSALSGYYIYIARKEIRTKTERLSFVSTAVIPLVPVLVYTINILNYYLNDTYSIHTILNNFNMEWIFVTPLLLLNFTHTMRISIHEQFFLILCVTLMNLCGYISNLIVDPFYISYSLGCVFFIIILLFLTYLYNDNDRFIKKSIQYSNRLKILYKSLTLSIITTWSLYPIVFILMKNNTLAIHHSLFSFICLDFLSKGIFTFLLISEREIIYQRDSFVNQIYPLESIESSSSISIQV
jgi:bacteriorhodopsin